MSDLLLAAATKKHPDVACSLSKSHYSCAQFKGPAIEDKLFTTALTNKLHSHG